MTKIQVKSPINIFECFGEWSEWKPKMVDEESDDLWVRTRPMRDYTLTPGEYELESVLNPVFVYEDGKGAANWFVLKGTEIGTGNWERFIASGEVEVLA